MSQSSEPSGTSQRPSQGSVSPTVKDIIVATMKEQQASLLQLAAKNAEQIVKQKLDEGSVRAVVDKEINRCTKYDNIEMNNNINATHFNFTKQIHDLWEKAEIAIGEKTDPTSYLTKGKELCEGHLKLIQLADREGWDVAKRYQEDLLASDPQDEKRIAKAIREAHAKREKKHKKLLLQVKWFFLQRQ